MKKGGRRSYAEQRINAAVVPGVREPAPADLEPEAVALWNGIVLRLPAEFFTIETLPLLKAYCRHAIYADQFAAQITALQGAIARVAAGEDVGVDGVDEDVTGLDEKGAISDQDAPHPVRQRARRLAKMRQALHALHKMHGTETDHAVSVATKLRITNQSRFVTERAGTQARAGNRVGLPPWADWGDAADQEQEN
jgi:hypothetical protein